MVKPRIRLIGFDSMGTRGMATVVDTGSYKVFIDPGVSIAPRRYGLPPHPLELELLEKHLGIIHEEVLDSDVLVISHYHRDHYLYRPGEEEYYRGKLLLVKDPRRMINRSQAIRSYILFKKMNVEGLAREIKIADNMEYYIDKDTRIIFSPPFPHGPEGTRLGYVIITTIEIDGHRLMHASDVQGPISNRVRDYILTIRPNLLIISGPPTYFEGFKMSPDSIRNGLNNLRIIIGSLDSGSTIIVDHHLLRDLNYKDKIIGALSEAKKKNINVLTAAEYMGYKPNQLEALRKKLWGREQ